MIVVVLPAYQAAKTLKPFLDTLPKQLFDKIILVDDSSKDRTFAIAQKIPWILAYQTTRNLGYGGNMKMCLKIALDKGADVVVELHPDGEYLPDGILPALEKIKQGAELVLGNRFKDGRPFGMYLWKYLANKTLTFIDNLILGSNISDFHQGFRVYTRQFLKKINFQHNSDNYTFTFEIIVQAIFFNIPIVTVPVTAVYKGKKRGVSVKNGILYTIKSFWVLMLYFLAKYNILKSNIFI